MRRDDDGFAALPLPARRHRGGVIGGLIRAVAWLPWWMGLALAVAVWLWLHRLSQRGGVALHPAPTPGQPMADWLSGLALHSLAVAGQLLLPALCVTGAMLSAWRRWQRRRVVAAALRGPEALQALSWRAFETLVAEAFRRHGWRVEETGGGGPDGGVDLLLRRDGEIYFVQCKQWKALRVGVQVVRELYGVVAAHGAAGGFVVTSGRFTLDAETFARGCGVALIDGDELRALVREVRHTAPAHPGPAPGDGHGDDGAGLFHASSDPEGPDIPDCPRCGAPMRLRTTRRGVHAGRAFWGCTGYPACRGVRAATDDEEAAA